MANDYVHEAADGSRPWREQAIELAVFLFLIGPSMALSFFDIRGDGASFELAAVLTILRDLALVALIAFFLWRNGEQSATIGCIPRAIGREMALGAVLFIPMLLLTLGLDRLLRGLGLSSPPPPPGVQPAATLGQISLAIVLVAVVAVAEELIFRGYLLRRLGAVTRRPWLAVVLGAMIFAVGHGYEGQAGVITVGFMGLLFGIVAVWRGSLGAPITMHFMQDFLAVVLAPLLARQ